MTFFLTLIIIGLAGLGLMALPGMRRGHMGFAHHGGHAALPSGAHAHLPTLRTPRGPDAGHQGALWHIPSPRLIFSLITLYGAFGYAFVETAHFHTSIAALLAVIPAVALERFVMTPVWNLMFRFQGTPSDPISQLVMTEAVAVTPFRNQKGLVSVTHNGRLVQFAAELIESDAARPVNVGDRLLIEVVDSEQERLRVSVI